MESAMLKRAAAIAVFVVFSIVQPAPGQEELKIGLFAVDASPPVGSPLAYDPTKEVTLPLSCRGLVLLGQGRPIVLCAVDWIGIGNDGHKEFRRALAEAAGTIPERVAVHTVHPHDAPACDFSADELLKPLGISRQVFDSAFARDVLARASAAVRHASRSAAPITHLGVSSAPVEKVASNRRILGPDGKVKAMRFTACKDPAIRAEPVGTVDPELKMISFWAGEKPIAALTYFATHPQSYYRTGGANPDFPGIARNLRQEETGVMHIHFNGAGGNVGAGKWNDGSPENRKILADRVAAAMENAWKSTRKSPLDARDVGWESMPVRLPAAGHLDEGRLLSELNDTGAAISARSAAATNLAWLRRCKTGDTVDISCLRLGKARILHMAGELFVEYQLSAQKMRPDLFVAMAAYGDYAPGYIGTKIAYGQGGYETSPAASRVAPEVEEVLTRAMKQLLARR
jgi:hypothetical protein